MKHRIGSPQIKATSSVTSEQVVTQLADLFSLMGDPSRLKIIINCLHEPVSVSDIAADLGLSQSLVSHHLRLLRAARMVRSERRGKQVFYTAADEHVTSVIEDMLAHMAEPDEPHKHGES